MTTAPNVNGERTRSCVGAVAGVLLPAALVFCMTGCARAETVSVPFLRLAATNDGTVVPSVTIGDDTRDTLESAGEVALLYASQVVPAGGVFRYRSRLPDALVGAARFLLLPVVHVAGEPEEFPAALHETGDVEPDGTRYVTYEVPVPGIAPGTAVVVAVRAVDVTGSARREVRTKVFKVPVQARLEVASGIVGSPVQASASFAIDACRGGECRTIYQRVADAARAEERGWNDVRVDLGELAGSEVALIFRGEVLDGGGEPAAVPVWANPVVVAPRALAHRPPNILLISIDTLSAKHLELYGHERDTAPFLAEIAAQGVLFEQCVASATHTLESHMTMMTGLAAADHGVHALADTVDRSVPMLAERLRARGLATAAFTEDAWIGVRFGFARGFDVFRENRSPDLMSPEGHVATTFDNGIDWLAANGNRPFFLFLHTYQVHEPYVPPRAYRDLFGQAEATTAAGLPEWKLDELNYDREIRYVDDELRRLWTRVVALGYADETILVVTSDHGEAFMEHGWLRHGSYLFEEVTHVPLLVRGPGIAVGARVAGTVGHADLVPTLLELAGAPSARGGLGLSLAPVLHDPRLQGRLFDRVATSETWARFAFGPRMERHDFLPPAFAAVQGRRKLARYPLSTGAVRYEYYDLINDPAEKQNLWATRGAEADDLRVLLDGFDERGRRMRDARAKQRDAAGPAQPGGDGSQDPALGEKLRALGYLN